VTDSPKLSRRALLGGSAASLGGLALGFAGGASVYEARADGFLGSSKRPFFGRHQTGVVSAPTAYARYITWDLNGDVTKLDLIRMMKILTSDAARLTQGLGPLADPEPELAVFPANLMMTVGFGRRLVLIGGGKGKLPSWLGPLPPYPMDRLEEPFTGGDVLLIVQSDDPVTVAHASRVMVRQWEPFVTLRSVQDGFRRAAGSAPDGHTMRNLMGQVDGTKTPRPGTDDFNRAVFGVGSKNSQPDWLQGGTGLVLRRIRMELEAWDRVDRPDREKTIGRTLETGAPLTGGSEYSEPDFEAKNVVGLPVIPDFSHMKRARPTTSEEVFYRRGYNYEVPHVVGKSGEAGLLFEAMAWNPAQQFVPVQNRLAELDLLNLYTTPVGSSVFALPPGCQEGGFLGDSLLLH
jgi:dye decolorizing peroxidase